MTKNSVTLVLPFHSDGSRLKNTVPFIQRALRSDSELLEEVILSRNGSCAGGFAMEVRAPFRLLQTDRPGIGEGYAQGILGARTHWVLLSASDLPFGLSELEAARKDGFSADLYIGSKLHPLSRVEGHGFLRLACSYLFYAWRRLLFGPSTPRDSQGTILVLTKTARALLAETKSRDFFFSVEFIFRAQAKGMTGKEVPVTLNGASADSSVRIFRDGFLLFAKTLLLRAARLREPA
jgi:hypothetical protein